MRVRHPEGTIRCDPFTGGTTGKAKSLGIRVVVDIDTIALVVGLDFFTIGDEAFTIKNLTTTNQDFGGIITRLETDIVGFFSGGGTVNLERVKVTVRPRAENRPVNSELKPLVNRIKADLDGRVFLINPVNR